LAAVADPGIKTDAALLFLSVPFVPGNLLGRMAVFEGLGTWESLPNSVAFFPPSASGDTILPPSGVPYVGPIFGDRLGYPNLPGSVVNRLAASLPTAVFCPPD
jgi:hypothetical protein